MGKMLSLLQRLVLIKVLLIAALTPLVLAMLLTFSLVRPYMDGWRGDVRLQTVRTDSAEQLEALFDAQGYGWPPTQVIPSIAVQKFPKGMTRLEAGRKKALFFRTLLPLVEAENARVRTQRGFLKERFANGKLRTGTRTWAQLETLADHYRITGDLNDAEVRERLLRRVDEVPAALVLAQAANESAWGGSRFVREANNLFGLWTYTEALGMVPERRAEDAKHFVRVFSNLRSSVRAYIRNINIGHAYDDLRQMRAQMRERGEVLDVYLLSGGLLRYSERGEEYVNDIRAMIRFNGLDQLERVTLAPLP